LGELDGDKGWCSGAVAMNIRSGEVDGVDVSGVKVALIGDWPRGFLAADGVGRLYFDTSVSAEQRAALEPVIQGKRGGALEAFNLLVQTWHPSEEATVDISTGGDELRLAIGGAGEATAQVLKGPTGERTRLLHAAAGFRDDIVLAKTTSSRFAPAGMREWDSAGHAETADFDWSA